MAGKEIRGSHIFAGAAHRQYAQRGISLPRGHAIFLLRPLGATAKAVAASAPEREQFLNSEGQQRIASQALLLSPEASALLDLHLQQFRTTFIGNIEHE